MSAEILRDRRSHPGRIWNVHRVVERYPFGSRRAPWNRGARVTDPRWIDTFVYTGFRKYGAGFLRALHGRFAIAMHDPLLDRIFLARDWIGETPMHTLATPTGFYVANTISELQAAAGDEYAYAYVRAFPHAYYQEIDLRGIDVGCVALTMRPHQPVLYLNFEAYAHEVEEDVSSRDPEHGLDTISKDLKASIRERLCGRERDTQAVLLSGGLDSFTVAVAMKTMGVKFEAYTLAVGGQGGDAAMAEEFARRLGVRHHLIDVREEQVVATFEDAVRVGETYHLFNVYCTLGMTLIAQHLAGRGVRSAHCGEAVNEAVGDYRDWIVVDPRTGQPVTLQRVDHDRLARSSERLLYVWGQPVDCGKYNRQLGTGLAKHASARMIKPFAHHGVTLECPYYEIHLLARLVATPPEMLDAMGGKPGLMARAFRHELGQLGIDESFVTDCKKVRLQDASEGGEGGLTPVLLAAGCDQRRTIETFNRQFGATLDPVIDARRLALTS